MSFQEFVEAAARRWRGIGSIAILPAIFFLPISARGGQAWAGAATVPAVRISNPAGSSLGIEWAQDDDEGGAGVPAQSITKYVAVYRDMQRNRSLTVQQAAAQEGMSLEEFRKLEGEIERDSTARQQARDELKAAATTSPSTPLPSANK